MISLANWSNRPSKAVLPLSPGQLARVFLRSSIWHDAVLAWDVEAQDKCDEV